MAMKLAPQYDFEVKMITTVFGNCGLDQVIKNVSKCRHAASCPHITISRGCEHPIIKENILDASYFHGLDGMGNNSFPDQDPGINENSAKSPQCLIDIVREAKSLGKELTLLMIGPLTNLAEAIKLNPTFICDISRLVVMGGCGNARGNVFRTAEFNIVSDPDAASIVFHNLLQNNKLCTIVSWELTLSATIPWTLFDEVNSTESAKKSRVNEFLRGISSHSYAVEKRKGDVSDCRDNPTTSGAVICDALALAVAFSDPEVIIEESKKVNVEVELEGQITRGQTVVDWGCFDGVERKPNCEWILEVDSNVFRDMFISTYDK